MYIKTLRARHRQHYFLTSDPLRVLLKRKQAITVEGGSIFCSLFFSSESIVSCNQAMKNSHAGQEKQ